MYRLLVLGALFLACTAPTEPNKPAAPTPPAPPAAVTPPAAPSPPIAATPPTPPVMPVAPPPPTVTAAPLPPLAGHRDIHPLGGDATLGCIEMYSACTPDPKGGQRCTSASYNLDCGQTGQVPGGDRLRCVCP